MTKDNKSTQEREKELTGTFSLNAKIRTVEGKRQVWDMLRRRYVALTPEELVRQYFVEYLVNALGYPVALMANEVSITLNGMTRRCDTVLYWPDLKPRMIIEYKRTTVPITQRVFNQICRYNLTMHVDYLIVSNGINHYCCHMDYKTQTYHFLPQIPTYQAL